MIRTFSRALAVTYGRSPGRATIWCVLLILRALSVPLLIWLTGYIIAMVIGTEFDTSHLFFLAFLWLLSLTIGSALSPWIAYFEEAIGEDALAALQTNLVSTMNKVPDITMLENTSFHDNIAMTTRHLETTPLNFMGQCELAFESLITIVALVFIIAELSWAAVAIIIVFFIPHILMMRHLAKHNYWSVQVSTAEWREVQYCASLTSSSSFAKETRLFSSAKYSVSKCDTFFLKMNNILLGAKLRSNIFPIPTLLLQQTGSLICLLILFRDFQAGLLGAAAIVVMLQSLRAIQGKFELIMQAYHYVLWNLMHFEALFKVLDIQPAIAIHPKPLSISVGDAIDIRFDNVCFAYPNGPQVLTNLSFTWKWGEHLALVGENGGGKSTIVKLLLRFYDPDAGVIYINERPLADYDLDQWRGVVAPVFQDFGRYEYSIRENLHFANPSVDDADTLRILKSCGLSELVESLPEGMETRLGKRFGTTDLSGGQWQKLAIARALCKPSSIMLLDEPTAALDPRMESDIYRLFEALSAGKSTLMITHRLGSTRMADMILVLSAGHIVESGSHEALMKLNGSYAQMFRDQADWYRR